MFENLYIIEKDIPKPFSTHTVCEIEPKPLYCEPEDIRLRPLTGSGTAQTYTLTSSMASLPIFGTTTTI